MQGDFQPGDPFHGMEASDGFHILKYESEALLTLSCVAYAGGLMLTDGDQFTSQILTVNNPTRQQLGAAERLRLVLDAVCRYLNTGGNWAELYGAADKMRPTAANGLKFHGYYLCATYSTNEGTYQHVFTRAGTEQAVLWEEPGVGDNGLPVGGWIESTTLKALAEQDDDDAGGREEGEAEEDAGPDRLQLPPGPGL